MHHHDNHRVDDESNPLVLSEPMTRSPGALGALGAPDLHLYVNLLWDCSVWTVDFLQPK